MSCRQPIVLLRPRTSSIVGNPKIDINAGSAHGQVRRASPGVDDSGNAFMLRQSTVPPESRTRRSVRSSQEVLSLSTAGGHVVEGRPRPRPLGERGKGEDREPDRLIRRRLVASGGGKRGPEFSWNSWRSSVYRPNHVHPYSRTQSRTAVFRTRYRIYPAESLPQQLRFTRFPNRIRTPDRRSPCPQ